MTIYSQNAIVDRIIENRGLEWDYTTRAMILGVMTMVVKKYESRQSYDIESITDEVMRSIDTVLRINDLPVRKKDKTSFEELFPWIFVSFVAISTFSLILFLWYLTRNGNEDNKSNVKHKHDEEFDEEDDYKKNLSKDFDQGLLEDMRKISKDMGEIRKSIRESSSVSEGIERGMFHATCANIGTQIALRHTRKFFNY
jgi:hypothetical protein